MNAWFIISSHTPSTSIVLRLRHLSPSGKMKGVDFMTSLAAAACNPPSERPLRPSGPAWAERERAKVQPGAAARCPLLWCASGAVPQLLLPEPHGSRRSLRWRTVHPSPPAPRIRPVAALASRPVPPSCRCPGAPSLHRRHTSCESDRQASNSLGK